MVDDFNAGNDSAWTRVDPLGNAVYTFPGGNTYSIGAPKPATGALGPARAGAYLTGLTLGDFRITVDLVDWDNSAITHQAIGIVARAGQFGLGSTDGYYFHYDPVGTAGGSKLWIDLITDEASAGGASSGITALNPALDYRLEFTGVGSVFTGKVYAFGDFVNALSSVTFTDSTYASGGVALLVADQGALTTGNQSGLATFDNFSATAIPEPATTALALAGGCVLGTAYLRRRRACSRP